MNTVEYMNHRYRHNNHRYWWGIAHRARLIDSGQYIKTSEKTRLTIRWTDPKPRTLSALYEAWGEAWGEAIRLAKENS